MRYFKSLFVVSLLVMLAACSRDPEQAKRSLVETGNKYFASGKFKEASIVYRKAIQRDARYGEAYYRLGLTELKLGRINEAVRSLRRASELMPKNTDAHSKLAEIYLSAYAANPKKMKEALKECAELADRMLALDPRSFMGLRMKGYVALAQDPTDLKGALDYFRQADQTVPLDKNMSVAWVTALYRDQQREPAEKLARQVIEKYKDYGPMYDLLYVELLRAKREAEAESLLKLKIQNIPKQLTGYIQLAAYYLQQRRTDLMTETLALILAKQKEFPMAHMAVGDFYQRTRNPDLALYHFREGLRLVPKQRAAHQKKIVEILAAKRQMEEARQLADTIVKENPKDQQAKSLRASLVVRGGDRKELDNAIIDLKASVAANPKNHVARYNLAQAFLSKGDLNQGLTQLEEAVKLRSDYIPPKMALANIHMRRREFAKAVQLSSEVLALRADPKAQMTHAQALVGIGEVKQGRLELEAILKANANARDALFLLARLDLREKNYRQAEDRFRSLYMGKQPDVRGLRGLTDVYIAQGRGELALQMMQTEIKRAPDVLQLRSGLAQVAAQIKNYDIAIAEYKNLIDKVGNTKEAQRALPDLYTRLGDAYRLAGQYDQAVTHLQKAVQLQPQNVRAKFFLAMTNERLGHKAEAVKMYEQILKAQPDNPIVLNNLAFAMAEAGRDLDLALSYAQKAKQRLPNHAEVSDTLGWIYIKKNLSDNAIQIFQDLVKKEPASSTFRYHLAMAFFQKGDRPKARRELESALRNKPPKDEEDKIRELLGKLG